MKKVSVILTAYNAATTVCRAIESVQRQSYPGVELIVVNDQSTDSTGEMIARMNRDDDFLCVRTPENVGCGGARKYGLQFASGELVCFLDSDDWYDRDFVERMVAEIGDADMCHCPLLFINERSGERNEHSTVAERKVVTGAERLLDLENHWLTSFNCGIFRKELLERVEYSDLRCLDDRHTGIKLQVVAERHVVLPKGCGVRYNYNVRGGSVFQTLGAQVPLYEMVLWLDIDEWTRTEAAAIEGGKHADLTQYVLRIVQKFIVAYPKDRERMDALMRERYDDLMYRVARWSAAHLIELTNKQKEEDYGKAIS